MISSHFRVLLELKNKNKKIANVSVAGLLFAINNKRPEMTGFGFLKVRRGI